MHYNNDYLILNQLKWQLSKDSQFLYCSEIIMTIYLFYFLVFIITRLTFRSSFANATVPVPVLEPEPEPDPTEHRLDWSVMRGSASIIYLFLFFYSWLLMIIVIFFCLIGKNTEEINKNSLATYSYWIQKTPRLMHISANFDGKFYLCTSILLFASWFLFTINSYF